MSLRIAIEWSYTGPGEESLEFSRVLYAYLHPDTSEILYVGKADHCSVYERLHGPHKQDIFSDIIDDLGLSTLHAIVGLLSLPPDRQFSSALLTDVESLLIMGLQPTYNMQ